MKTLALVVSLFGMLAMSVWGAIYVWNEIGDIEMSTAGILAMVTGVVLSLSLGMGLMFLVFKGEREGADNE